MNYIFREFCLFSVFKGGGGGESRINITLGKQKTSSHDALIRVP